MRRTLGFSGNAISRWRYLCVTQCSYPLPSHELPDVDDGRSMMSMRLSTSLVAAAFVFGSTLSSTAGNGNISASAADARRAGAAQGSALVAPPSQEDAAAQIARLFRQAPVGHRQPRPIDTPASTQKSPIRPETGSLDEEIKPKLVICRGC
jgi:hypothetical protein